ncbi:hypothetical protein LIER_22057 [Lithospermum erythrorhizon]|uniref:Glycosyl transferase family 1 domain-containing protein n=1 Tax=Lithospermum erythrorhizon TaxID=34254 RepID=A0AAV3QVJ6_LITER
MNSIFKPIFILSSLSIIFIAIILSNTEPSYFRSHFLSTNLLERLLAILSPTHYHKYYKVSNFGIESYNCVLWMAPFLSGGGYSSEAWSYILALNNYLGNSSNPSFKLGIEHHGDMENLEFWEGLPLEMRDLAIRLHGTQCRLNQTVVVCHSEPGAWYPLLFETLPCPPFEYGEFKAVIGRTMFETDRVNKEHVERCNRMDYVWVPTDFHVRSFIGSGVDPLKVVKVIQSVDVEFFDPVKCDPLDLRRLGNWVLGQAKRGVNPGERFVFLSIFKWEFRKGWDVLLMAYLKEFSADDDVELYLLTNPYHSDSDFGNQILEYVNNSNLEKPESGWASINVIDKHIAHVDLPRLYKAANVFVLPSRGEGWGRPLVEAMSMSLPVIATNWSGPTEYLTENNGYPLPVAMNGVLEGPFQGHLWAEPSVDKLQDLMRHVVSNREEAKSKGKRARADMISRFSPEIVAQLVANLIQRVINS